jgi:hypothetical protein
MHLAFLAGDARTVRAEVGDFAGGEKKEPFAVVRHGMTDIERLRALDLHRLRPRPGGRCGREQLDLIVRRIVDEEAAVVLGEFGDTHISLLLPQRMTERFPRLQVTRVPDEQSRAIGAAAVRHVVVRAVLADGRVRPVTDEQRPRLGGALRVQRCA